MPGKPWYWVWVYPHGPIDYTPASSAKEAARKVAKEYKVPSDSRIHVVQDTTVAVFEFDLGPAAS